jgi:hypothetical protein
VSEPAPAPAIEHVLVHMDGALADATAQEWLEQAAGFEEAEKVMQASGYRRIADWISDYGKAPHATDRIYGLVQQGKDHACAVIEVVHAPRVSRLKLLSMYFEPRLDILEVYESGFQETLAVMATSTLMSVNLIFSELPAKQIKIYGRNSHMHALFDRLRDIFSGSKNPLPVIEAARHGAWLTFTKAK